MSPPVRRTSSRRSVLRSVRAAAATGIDVHMSLFATNDELFDLSVTPEVNAASTVLIVITTALTALALRLQDRNAAHAVGAGA